MAFKDVFLKTPPGPKREALIYEEVVRRGPPKNLVPITVNAPDGSKITYKVMPDYIMIDGIRVPMSGITAQRVADHFGMKLPTTVMSKQIWEAADTRVRPAPLSGGGKIGDRYYTGKKVVDKKISDSDSSIAYNELIDKELAKKNNGGAPTLVAGHMKDVVQPVKNNNLGLYGWYDSKGKPIQNTATTGHDISVHTEYGAGTRLALNEAIVTRPDGTVEKKTLDDVQNDPVLSKAISNTVGVKRYDPKGAAQKSAVPPTNKGNSNGVFNGPPPGYKVLKKIPPGMNAKAKTFLNGNYGDTSIFQMNGKNYAARVEQHYHPPGYVGGPIGKHKGVTIYEAIDQNATPPEVAPSDQKTIEPKLNRQYVARTETSNSGRMQFLQRIDKFLSKLNGEEA